MTTCPHCTAMAESARLAEDRLARVLEGAKRARAERDRLREVGTALASWVGDVLQGWQAHAQIASGKGGGMGGLLCCPTHPIPSTTG